MTSQPQSNPLPALTPPKVFVSYTHENAEHRKWIARLCSDLCTNGVDTILDQWDCKLGTDLTQFMENGISQSDRVLLIATPEYKRKAEQPTGGAGYEKLVVTGELARSLETTKFVCLLRRGEPAESIPRFAMSRLFADFRDESQYLGNLEQVLRDIHGAPTTPKPPIGTNPFSKEFRGEKQEVSGTNAASQIAPHKPPHTPVRRLLPDSRRSLTHKFNISGQVGFITVGMYEDGRPGEVFITLAKQGSTLGGLTDAWSITITTALQHGVRVESLVAALSDMRFEPNGMTENPEIPFAKSIPDYVIRWLAMQYIPGYREAHRPGQRT
ncbi:MAG: TIR domain-containing protein [Planctomycetota bacterium]